jgi:hypothetical protein
MTMATLQQRFELTDSMQRPITSAVAVRNTFGSPGAVPAVGAITKNGSPQRPDASVLSAAIPLVFIGRNSAGFWVARDADGRFGGLFLFKRSAVCFADTNSAPTGCAKMFVSHRFELDIENKGNSLVVDLMTARRMMMRRRMPKIATLVGEAIAKLRAFIAQVSRAHAEELEHRQAIESELFGGQYRISSKNDDDLPIVR